MAPVKDNPPKASAPACPICGKLAATPYKPFCSKRCAHVDLQRWLTGRYAIPVVEEDRGLEGGESEDER